MYEIHMFLENFGHEVFLQALLLKAAEQYGLHIKLVPRSNRGGHGRMVSELKQFLRDLKKGQNFSPDLIIIVRDANCQGVNFREKELSQVVKNSGIPENLFIYAIPDPHIERWLLLDSQAFKEVLGRGCDVPTYKCDRDKYKKLLIDSVRSSGVQPLLGGMEYAEDIVNAMDLERVRSVDNSLGRLINDIHIKMKEWTRSR